jgi:2-polyprenyl-3-methyl-5-hydroxy-6-metoxy-1,4-benzoquinol methylase
MKHWSLPMIPMRALMHLVALVSLFVPTGCTSSPEQGAEAEPAAASGPAPADEASPELEAYLQFRRWVNAQPEELRARERDEVLAAYAEHLAGEGLDTAQIAEQETLLETGGERQEVELWNRVLTEEEPRFNTDPNAFLVRMVQGRTPGRALDVGMGQGRNAIWLAQEGWDVTGFDPADKAVALAHELATAAGVEITTEIVGSEEFDWGVERWDLIVLSYVSVRDFAPAILESLKPGGLIVLEAFHDDATKEGSIGRGVVWDSNELLQLFSDARILHYEDTVAVADFGRRETPVVRLLAMKRRE